MNISKKDYLDILEQAKTARQLSNNLFKLLGKIEASNSYVSIDVDQPNFTQLDLDHNLRVSNKLNQKEDIEESNFENSLDFIVHQNLIATDETLCKESKEMKEKTTMEKEVAQSALNQLERRNEIMRIAGKTPRQRKNGTWELRIFVNGSSKSIYGKTLTQLKEHYDIWYKENEREKRTKTASLSIKDWTEKWLNVYKKGKVTDSTFKSVCGICNRYIINNIGERKLSTIRNIDCQELMNKLNHLGNSKNKTYFYLKDIFSKAVANNLIKKNPAENLNVARSYSESSKALTHSEQQYLIKFPFDNDILHLYYCFVLFTGCRRSEALSFNHAVDVKDGFIHIHGTKTKGSDRYIPYFKQIAELFNGHEATIFKKIPSDIVTRKIKLALQNHTVKDLRTTFATNCHEIGIAPKVVQQWLGHASLNMTMNVYTQVQTDFELSEAEKYSDVFTQILTPKIIDR